MESAHVEPNLMGPGYESLQHFVTGCRQTLFQWPFRFQCLSVYSWLSILQIMLHLDEDYLEVF